MNIPEGENSFERAIASLSESKKDTLARARVEKYGEQGTIIVS